MKKLNRTLLIVLLAQVGLGAALFVGRSQASIARSEKVFAGLDPEKVTRLEVSGPTGVDAAPEKPAHVVLAKDGAQWRFPEADGYPADGAKVKELLDKLARLEARGVVVRDKKHYGRLQVKDDAYQRLVKLTEGGKELAFYLGASSGGSGAFLRRKGESDVLPVSGLRTWDVGDSPSAWLSRDYVKVDEAELWNVRIENAKGTIELSKGDGGEWSVAGETASLDKHAVDDLARKAAAVSLEAPAGKTVKPEHGLDKPLATVTLSVGKAKEGGGRPDASALSTQTFLVGAKIEPLGRHYVKSSGSEYVVEAGSWGVEPFVSKARADLLKKPDPSPAPAPPTSRG